MTSDLTRIRSSDVIIGLGLGIGAGSQTFAYNYTNAEAAAYVAAMSVNPTDTRKGLIDTFIGSLKSAGVWSLLDLIYLMAAHDSQAGLLNLKAPASFTLVPVASPVFATDLGYTGDGSSSYLRTQWNGSTNGVNFTLNNASAWAWCTTSGGTFDHACGANDNTHRTYLGPNLQSYRVNGPENTGSTTPVGLHGVSRASSSTTKGWKNGVQVGSDFTATSDAVANAEMWVCSESNGDHCTNQVAFAAFGAALTGKEVAFYNAVQTYLHAIGAA